MKQISKTVQEFYNKTPFPDYDLDRFNSKEDLRVSAYSFAEILNRSIPKEASIIDVGTGTGQLSAYLSLNRKCVWGIDFSDSSLNKARALKEKINLKNYHLKKVDITKEIKINRKFDYVLCLGVLHHTENAYDSFKNILPLLKPNGKIVIGLYNRFGRIPLKVRIKLAKTIFKNNQKVKDYFIRLQIGEVQDKERARGWWNDQYLHPHETTHTIGQVLRWFKRNNIKYYQSVPNISPKNNECNLSIGGVWNDFNETYPNLLLRTYYQLKWIYTTHKEGGYWITFGKKI